MIFNEHHTGCWSSVFLAIYHCYGHHVIFFRYWGDLLDIHQSRNLCSSLLWWRIIKYFKGVQCKHIRLSGIHILLSFVLLLIFFYRHIIIYLRSYLIYWISYTKTLIALINCPNSWKCILTLQGSFDLFVEVRGGSVIIFNKQ